MNKPFKRMAVIGTGLLGTQIAMISAYAGYKVSVYDTREGAFNETYEKLYADLKSKGVEVLYDDREASAGEKFADSDLIGIPYRAVVSRKTLEAKKIEVKERKTGKEKMVEEKEFVSGGYRS